MSAATGVRMTGIGTSTGAVATAGMGGGGLGALPGSSSTSGATTTTPVVGGRRVGGGEPDFGSLLASSSSLLSSTQRGGSGGGGRVSGAGSGASALALVSVAPSTQDADPRGGGAPSSLIMSVASPSLKKSLRELGIASAALGQEVPTPMTVTDTGAGVVGAATTTMAPMVTNTTSAAAAAAASEAAAHRLLAREGGGFDAVGLGRSAKELEYRLSQPHPSTAGAAATGASGANSASGQLPQPQQNQQISQSKGQTQQTPMGATTVATSQGQAGLFTPQQGESLDNFLSRQLKGIVREAVTYTMTEADRASTQMIRHRKMEIYEREKEEMLAELAGYRSVSIRQERPQRSFYGAGYGDAPQAEQHQSRGQTLSFVDAPFGRTTGDSRDASVHTAMGGGGSQLPESPRRHAAIVASLNARERSHTPFRDDDILVQFQTVAQRLAREDARAGRTSADSSAAYANAWSLLQSMLCRSDAGGTRRRFGEATGSGASNSGSCRDRAVGALSHLCRHFRDHLCEKVRNAALAGRVGVGSTQGRSSSSSSSSALAEDVASYVELEMGPSATAAGGGSLRSGALLWPRVYLCLRCGDAQAALETLGEMRSFSTNGGDDSGGGEVGGVAIVEPAILALVSDLSQRQSARGAESLFDNEDREESQNVLAAIAQHRRDVAELYHRAKTRSHARDDNQKMTWTSSSPRNVLYKVATLALLSVAGTVEEEGIVETIEDYLFAHLWLAVQTLPSSSSSASSSVTDRADDSTWSTHLGKLGKMIRHWGPSYFEGKDNGDSATTAGGVNVGGGWEYAMPLLITQQFASAVVHLSAAAGCDLSGSRSFIGGGVGANDGLLQATHLGLALDVAGVPLKDLARDYDNEGTGGRGEAAFATSTSGSASPHGGDLLASLLVYYSVFLRSVEPEAALEYLVRIPDDESSAALSGDSLRRERGKVGKAARQQIKRLILETRAFEILVGSISSDGVRGGGALDAHLTPSEVSTLLEETARESAAASFSPGIVGANIADSAELLALAGRFGALLSLLNNELVSLLVVEGEKDRQRRRFWYDAAIQFQSTYLSHGRTHVIDVLEAEDNLSLGRTFELILNLMAFFDKCQSNEWEGALSLMENLQLIPTSDDQISWAVEAFHSQDGPVKRSYHYIVLATMEALYQMHAMLKSSSVAPTRINPAASATVEQRLMELRKRARVLVTFAGIIGLSNGAGGSADANARIARMEALMM